MLDEISYGKYQQLVRKADALHAELKELYGDRFQTNQQMYLRANLDGVITGEEWAILKQYHPQERG